MTYRERRERRAEQLRDWADKREARASASFDKAHEIGDRIPFGQPILVGHHSERGHRRDLARIDNAMRDGAESVHMAESMNSRANHIDDALATSIYSDDPDAVEALEARIAGLEAERDRIKAYNATCRRGSPDESLLDDAQRERLASVRKHAPYQLGTTGAFPAYALSNLNGNIKRNRDRLIAVRRQRARAAEAQASNHGIVIAGGDWVRVTFAEKPQRTVLDALKAAGFRWAQGSWHGSRANLPRILEDPDA